MPKLNMSFPFLTSYTRRRFQQLHHVLAEVLLNPLQVSTEQKGSLGHCGAIFRRQIVGNGPQSLNKQENT